MMIQGVTLTNINVYGITIQIGPAYNSNMISIERLI